MGWLLLAIPSALIVVWVVIRRRSLGAAPELPAVGEVREPPEDISPALVPYVITPRDPGTDAAGAAINAMLVERLRRGDLAWSGDHLRFVRRGESEAAYERDLDGYLETTATENGEIDPARLRARLERENALLSWAHRPRMDYEQQHGKIVDLGAYDRMTAPVAIGWLFGVGCVLLPWFHGLAVDRTPGGRALLVATACGAASILAAVLGGRAALRWLPAKAANAARWLAYRDALAAGTTGKDSDLAYALALGVGRQFAEHQAASGNGEPRRIVDAIDPITHGLFARERWARSAPPQRNLGLERLRERHRENLEKQRES
jgi:hypothetical protein